MSTLPENELNLEKLFLPAWAQEEASSSKYAHYEGETAREDRRGDRRGPRPPRRDGPRGPRREGDREGSRPRSDRPGGERSFEGRRERPAGPGGGQRPDWRGRPDRGPRGDRRGPRRDDQRERREPPPPLPEINLSLVPEEKGVDFLARQIRMTGRAYPLFDIAQMILQKPERYNAVFSIKKNPEGQPVQPLFLCALDDTLWLSEDEAVGHVLKKHFATFYQAERTATEPPKGKYTFVAQCGISGVILGPPNYHDYQNQLRKLHAERFSRMPFEAFKSRVRIVREEEVVKKWVEDQSWKTEYTCLNMPEPLRLPTMDEVEKHFRQNHKENIIKQVETHTLNGQAARNLRSQELTRLVRMTVEDQRHFPLRIATTLSQQFSQRGLQFFKVNKSVTHVSVARPHYLDLSLTPVSETVHRIVDFINAHPKCTRRQLLEALAPTPAAPPPAPVPAHEAAPAQESQPVVEGQVAPAEPAQPSAPPTPPPAPAPTPEQTAVIGDLHWLVHQGHVIEFATGVLETAKKPLPKPPKPEPKPAATAAPVEAPAEAAPQAAPETAAIGQAEGEAAPVEAPAAQTESLPGEVAIQKPPTDAAPQEPALDSVPREPEPPPVE